MDLENRLGMGLFRRKKGEISKGIGEHLGERGFGVPREKVDTGRRKTLRLLAGGVAAAALDSTLPTGAKAAHSSSDWRRVLQFESRIPNGVMNCNDKELVIAFTNNVLNNNEGTQIPFSRLSDLTKMREPAFYYVTNAFLPEGDNVVRNNFRPNSLHSANPGLYFFSEGIAKFHSNWKNRFDQLFRENRIVSTEADFIRSIMYAANQNNRSESENQAETYLNSQTSWDEKTRVILEAKSKLESRNSNYYSRLLAQWAAMYLTSSHRLLNENDKGDLINQNIEKPLRAEKFQIGKLRANYETGPYYIGNFGEFRF